MLIIVYCEERQAYLHVFMCQDAETPLIKATKMRNMEIVELLLDKGAKVSAVDKVKLFN